MRAINRSIIETVRTGDDEAGFGPAAVWLDFWSASDDLSDSSG